ncbi:MULTISPECIES: hypothetical protein [Kribbella]|uniref:Uncharacterized protein n=2 Tax=Kribbella TaxID=182639 RepID=A0A4R0ICY7_9ACTN|nr:MULTISPECIES: hypothetical protein [Kribbella]TCC22874.1 hypothetical protein E0H58_21110 [Kribbella speibonae]TCC28356.1 hypothetical protein E0H50_29015 [Kribbella sindirgiensis]TCC30259.1 hypothetical protein E0H92_40565 [Kribbella speibonae]
MNERNSYDIGASEEVQTRITQLSGQINSLIGQHERSVQALLSDASMTNVTEEYRGIESQFSKAAEDVRAIIKLLTDTLQANDRTAEAALKKASSAVNQIPH